MLSQSVRPHLAAYFALTAFVALVGCDARDDVSAPASGENGSPNLGSSGGGDACELPAGPYGTAVQDTLDPALAYAGFAEGGPDESTIALGDFVDCEAEPPHALVIYVLAAWCETCQEDMAELRSRMQDVWQDDVEVLVLLTETVSGAPAPTSLASTWIEEYALEDATVAVDPAWTLSNGTSASPQVLVVNPATLRVRHRGIGATTDFETALDELLSP